MSAKKVFWTKKNDIIKCWEDIQKFEKKFFPVKKQNGRQFSVQAPKWVFRATRSEQNLETGLQEKFNLNGVKRKWDFLGIQQEGDKLIDLAIACYLVEAKPALPCVYPVNPFRLNKRLSVQQGLFLMPGDITKSFAENLEATFKDFGGTKEHLWRLEIMPKENEDRNEILRKLKDMNISNEALFPGLDGFARSVGESLAYPRHPGDRQI